METLAEWSVTEYLGRDWPGQMVWRDLERPVEDGPLMVADDRGNRVPAQLGEGGGRVFYVADLPSGATVHYRLCRTEEVLASSLALEIGEKSIEIGNGRVGLRLAWTGSGADSPPLLGLRGVDGVWFGGSAWRGGVAFAELDCEVVEAGPVFARLRQMYQKGDGGAVCWEYVIDVANPAVRVRVRQEIGFPGEVVWRLGNGFRPERAFWRPHSPSPWRGERGEQCRQIYTLRYREEEDEVHLGPFYNWDKDAGSFWAGWQEDGRRDLIYLGCVRPGETWTEGSYERLSLKTGLREGQAFLDAAIPLQAGSRVFVLGLLDREDIEVRTQGAVGDLDLLHARLNGPGLDDYHQMTLDWLGLAELRFPRLWVAPEDLVGIRQRFEGWEWLRERFAEHVEDLFLNSHQHPDMRLREGSAVIGADMAGAYLVSGDEQYAARARESLENWLAETVDLLFDYGPSVGGSLGIGLSRMWRSTVVNLDFMLSSTAFPEAERIRVLRQLAFICEVCCGDDAWPPTGNGIQRGNPNFHPDVVSARGIAAALLGGHPRQQEWIQAAVAEMRRFLREYHFASGCSEESATYQLVSLAYALQMQAALGRLGYGELVEEPAFRRSFEYLAAIQTPVDPRCGFRMLPTIGHVTSYGWCQSLQAYFAWAARVAADVDREFSTRMMAAWKRGGGFIFSLHDFATGLIWSPPLCLFDGELPEEDDPDFLRSRTHEGLGTVMREVHGTGDEGYLLFKMGESTGHYDNDEGSFIWYAFGKPVLADFGCQYNPNFHAHPWLHNRISVDHSADGYPRGGRLVAHRFGKGFDFACGEVRINSLYRETEWPVREYDFDFRQVMGPHRQVDEHVWRRHLIYVGALEVVVLLDQIDGSLPTDWNLQVLAESVRVGKDRASFRGQFGVDLEVGLVQPQKPRLEISAYTHLGFDEPRLLQRWWHGVGWTAGDGISLGPMGEQALTLRGHAEGGQSYLAALAARRDGEGEPEILGVGDWGVEVRCARGLVRAFTEPPFIGWEIEVETADWSNRDTICFQRSDV